MSISSKPSLRAARGVVRAAALAVALTPGCAGPTLHVQVEDAATVVTANVLRAGAAETDLTPPPGAPLFGYALFSAAPAAVGYRTRLKAHAVVLEGPTGGRYAFVQVDLGAPSRLLQQLVVNRVWTLGFGPDRVLLAATHTHAGPGGFFENGFYNDFGAGRPGFDPDLASFLADRIAAAIATATQGLAPAAIGMESVHVPFATFNRSPAAWRENVCPGCGGRRIPEVDDRLTLLRVDRIAGNHTEPLGAFTVFAVHGTAVAEDNKLYHGDVAGYSGRRLASLVKRAHPGARAFVSAIVNGAEGDVSPTKAKQGFYDAELAGRTIAERAFAAYEAAGTHLSPDLDLTRAYREIVMPGAHTAMGDVCDEPMVGVSTIAGAEDGPSAFRGHFGVYEGRRRDEPEGCQGSKEPAFGSLTQTFVIGDVLPPPETMPRIATFSVVALHDRHRGPTTAPLVVYASVPGEPTTAVGLAIRSGVARQLVQIDGPVAPGAAPVASGTRRDPTDAVAVVGLTNDYLGYLTSMAEYDAQHYEGGSTFYGPLEALLATEQLEALASRVRERVRPEPESPIRERSANLLYYPENDYRPGHIAHFFGPRTDCAAGEASWAAGDVERREKAGSLDHVSFHYTGLHQDFFCQPPKIAIVCGGAPLVDGFGQPETDDGTRFEVRRVGQDEWTAHFFPTETERGQRHCRFEVSRTTGAPLVSPEFAL